MKKQMRLNGLDMNCVGCALGLWLHSDDRTDRYNTLDYWIHIARVLERGFFDSLFVADIFGIYDVYGGKADSAFRNAVEFPVNDPFLLVPAMAAATTHLGFGITGTIQWEGSWENDAVLREKKNRVFARPDKIHKVAHSGKSYRMEGYHICEPSPQRTPVLFQAGASNRGRDFAARHAECVFITGLNTRMVGGIVSDIRSCAPAFGRNPDDIVIYAGLAVVAAATDAEAREKVADYRRHASVEATLTLFVRLPWD